MIAKINKNPKITTTLVLLIAIGFCVSPSRSDQSNKVMTFLAVMDLKCGSSITAENCAALTNIVIDELVKLKKYTVIDRANRDKILSEQGFQQTGCVDEACTVEAGRLLGVGKIVVGAISRLGSTYLVNLQLINVETAALDITATEECKCDIDGLIATCRKAARKLMGESAPTTIQPGESSSQPLMAANGVMPEPPKGKARVVFYRTSSNSTPMAFKVNEGEALIGMLAKSKSFVYMTDPGKHTFWAKGQDRSDLTLDLKEGQTYFVELEVRPGGWYVLLTLIETRPDVARGELRNCVFEIGTPTPAPKKPE